jgi:hypothetical protein
MVCQNIEDLIDQNNPSCSLIVQEGESMNITGTLVDDDDVAIPKAGYRSFTITLHDEVSNVIINGRNDQDILDANGGTVNDDGSFIIRLGPDDAIIVSGTDLAGDLETHIVRIKWTWNDEGTIRTGIHQARIRVTKLGGS